LAYRFLSEPWFAEVARIRAEIGELGLPPNLRDLVINLEIREAPEGTVEAHVAGGAIERGLAPHASTKLCVPYDVAHKMFVGRDRGVAVQAFMMGRIKVEGDLGPLMTLQGTRDTPQSRELLDRITAITT
jgi:hypothetical protein